MNIYILQSFKSEFDLTTILIDICIIKQLKK